MKINKADKGASGFRKHFLFHWNRGRGHLLRYAWNRVRWHVYPRFHKAGAYPDHMDLELSAACNMKCPMCYTTTETFRKTVPHVNMSFDLYRKIIDEAVDNGVYSIRLSWRGEPTLNQNFMECVRYAKKKGIKEVDSLSNALRLTTEMFEELVDLQMDWLTISFDGVGETYEKIRAPAKFVEMVEKIRKFSEIKKRKKSVKPVLRIQGIWPAIADNPQAYFDTFEPLVDEVSVNTLLDYLHNDTDIQYVPQFVCPVIFQRLVIGSDGRAFMCINDDFGRQPIGDAKTESIYHIWNGPVMREIRNTHIRHKGHETYDPCKVCYLPRLSRQTPYVMGNRTIFLDELVGRPQAVGK